MLSSQSVLVFTLVGCGVVQGAEPDFQPLFPDDSLAAWKVSDWSNVALAQRESGAAWKLENGVLAGLGKRTWLRSRESYGDFVLQFEWKLGEGANSGVGLRFPLDGDPAFRGLEIQICDTERYYPQGFRPEQGTAAIYDAVAPEKISLKPVGEWNAFEITCQGSRIKLVVNDQTAWDVDLSKHKQSSSHWPDGTKPLAERPKIGCIGFQNLSGGITLRELQIKKL